MVPGSGSPGRDVPLPLGDRVRLHVRPFGLDLLAGAGPSLLVALTWERRPLMGVAGHCDWRLHGRLGRELIAGRMSLALGDQLLLGAARRLAGHTLLVVGLGAPEPFDGARAAAVAETLADTLRLLGEASCALEVPSHPCASARGEAVLGLLLSRWAASGSSHPLAVTALAATMDADALVTALRS
jgi:hypothetical protein